MSRTVVITGASSGIGRATAREFAGRGDRLVLAARSPATLAEVRDECRAAGAAVLGVPMDVGTPGALADLADAAAAEFDGIDAWVHTAAVMAYGRFDEVPSEVFEQVVRTDLLAAAEVARVALGRFRAASAGTLILTGSVLGHITAPYMSGYVAAKWGLQGLTRTLQQEARETPGIRICLINPGSVDTPVYRQAANYLGRTGRPPPPITTPERVARAIVHCADRPRREVSVGRLNLFFRFGFTVLPGVYDVLVGPLMRLAGLSNQPIGPHEGIVFAPNPTGEAVRGGWLPDLPQVIRALGTATAAAGSAVRRRRR
ncbi:SDR family NAD(P)-dependent oxidoreductase [Micromonospora sp. DR5-3]|uniref:SDR family NAD(P)-dependent oxidoreductase n=1 Tax=unclassified Micromonospora TaxID=2617518 RepID=UPI0011D5A6E1|nr:MULTISPECIES: SDR family NAD(P)-dependent oxidoreductase [unclassified Micromonospora]MCW3814967.1 SDR family NAD(P)-dependent oxidoreductase [Micromonospora sp. DR5-3]TYC25293.1 SDR family NAD(P)-dependent oxidoreductase [Micromonospora sp. MP36]